MSTCWEASISSSHSTSVPAYWTTSGVNPTLAIFPLTDLSNSIPNLFLETAFKAVENFLTKYPSLFECLTSFWAIK